MRGVLDALEVVEALHEVGLPSPLDSAKRIIVLVVNSLSSPPTNWDESYSPPGTVDILLKSAGTPIDAFSYETIESLKDTAARWATMRMIRNSPPLPPTRIRRSRGLARSGRRDLRHRRVVLALKDKKEFDYLNLQPTTFVLEPEAVDRLRAAGGTIIMDSPEFKRLLKDLGATIVAASAGFCLLRRRATKQPVGSVTALKANSAQLPLFGRSQPSLLWNPSDYSLLLRPCD
jgi:NTE family protein